MLFRSLLFLALALLIALPAQAQQRANDEVRASPNASVGQTIGTTNITVTYGRPSVRGREIFGDLVPYGEVWRTGANEATTISFSDDVVIEGQPLAAGTYSIFTIPAEDEWTVIFNKVAEQWGAYDYDAGQDALRVEIEAEQNTHAEMLTFLFDQIGEASGELILHWAGLRVPISISTGS